MKSSFCSSVFHPNWARQAIAGIPVIFIGFPYQDTLFRLFRGWFTYEESHSILILAISLYMIWMKRQEIVRLPKRPSLCAGTAGLTAGCLLLIAGKLSFTTLIQDASLVITLGGLILLIWGPGLLKALWLPLGYFLFMFPVFSGLLSNVSLYLQRITAGIAAGLLKAVGMPVLLSAQFIELPHITLEVAKACDGINHIMALVALSIPLGIMTKKSPLKRIYLVLIAFGIGILANGLRVGLIGIWSAYKTGGSLHGPSDIFYVSFIFFFGMGLLILINNLMDRPSKRRTFRG